jgi:hypothetical protein
LDDFLAFFGVSNRASADIGRRTVLFTKLRNRIAHHWPVSRDIRDFPVDVIDALADAKIERVNMTWAAQCSDVRLAKWSAERVRAFVDQWWNIGRIPAEAERLAWEYGPKWQQRVTNPSGDNSVRISQ